jgi:hypothetical protein
MDNTSKYGSLGSCEIAKLHRFEQGDKTRLCDVFVCQSGNGWH